MDIDRHSVGHFMGVRREDTSRKIWIRKSPWVIMGSLLVMAPIFIFMTMESIRTQRRNMEMLLSEKGGALIGPSRRARAPG